MPPGGDQRACCPLHLVAGAFSPHRHCSQVSGPGATPSFVDLTPKLPSSLCALRPDLTEGLYERLTEPLLFRGAQVLTMLGREVLPDHDILIEAGQVAGLWPTGGHPPPEARVIDARGWTIMPGLSDVHVHLFTAAWARAFAPIIAGSDTGEEYVLPYELTLFALLANGITRVEILAGCPDALWMRDAIASGQIVGPKMVVGSPLVDGNPPLHSPLVSYQAADYAGGIRAAELIAELGYDFAKPYSALSAEAFRGLIEGCERQGIRLMGHVPTAVGPEAAILAGQQGIAHVVELFYQVSSAERFDRDRLRRLLDLMAERQVWLQATVTVLDRVEALCGTRAFSAPDLKHMNPLHVAMWGPDSPLLATAARPERRETYGGSYLFGCEATRLAHERGVPLLTGTDCPNPYIVEGFSLHEELERLVSDCAIDAHDALLMCTRNAARYHRECERSGTIQVGAPADLVCLDGNPVSDIRVTRAIAAVVLEDKLLTSARIREGMARMHAKYDGMPPIELR